MCDRERYRFDFGLPDHPSCRESIAAVLAPYRILRHRIPDPINIFQNTTLTPDGTIETSEPLSRAGDTVSLAVLIDTLVVVSACPQDQTMCNGWAPSPIAVRVGDAP